MEALAKIFKIFAAKVKACLSVQDFPALPKDHEHPHAKTIATSKLDGKVPSAKDHEHPYARENPCVLENAETLEGKRKDFFCLKDHNHDGVYEKSKIVRAAKALFFQGFLSPRFFSPKDHDHPQYLRRGERAQAAKKLSGAFPKDLSAKDHEHPYVKKEDARYKRKDARANLAKALTKGRIFVVEGKERKGVVSVSGSAAPSNAIGYETFAALAETSVEEVRRIFQVVSQGSVNFCMDYVSDRAYYNPAGLRAVTKYLILFLPHRLYKKLQPVLDKAVVYMGDRVPSVFLTVPFQLSIIDAEKASLDGLVQRVHRVDRFWAPLVPPPSTSWLSFFDHLVYAIGTLFIIVATIVSIFVAAVVNALIDVFVFIADIGCKSIIFSLIFCPLKSLLLVLCVKPIGVFRALGSGLMMPIVFVQVQRNDPPVHWLAPGRVFGISVFARNIYQVVNGQSVKIGGNVVEVEGVAGGYFDDLEAATKLYFRQFEAHFPVVFYRAPSSGAEAIRVEGVYVARYTKPFDPKLMRFGAHAFGDSVLMKNVGLPYTLVCLVKGEPQNQSGWNLIGTLLNLLLGR